MNTFQLAYRMLSSGRILKRAKIAAQYAYYLGLETLSPSLSLFRPSFKPASGVNAPARDRTKSIEIHLVSDEHAKREFDQPDERRRSAVTHINDKFHTTTCFICDSALTPVIQVGKSVV